MIAAVGAFAIVGFNPAPFIFGRPEVSIGIDTAEAGSLNIPLLKLLYEIVYEFVLHIAIILVHSLNEKDLFILVDIILPFFSAQADVL